MKILVIGSCTGSKNDIGCPASAKLTEADFDDAVRLRLRQKELARWLKPAVAMYTGRQHTQMMDGVRAFRSMYGNDACDVAIVSAGYGLISETRRIAPYDLTFQGVPKPLIKARGAKLGVPEAVRKLIKHYPVVFLLLGDDYLRSAQPPLVPTNGQKFIAFGSPKLRSVPGTDVTVVPTGDDDAKEFGDTVRTRKGRMFHRLSVGLKQQPERWDAVLRDRTPGAVFALMRIGKCTFRRGA